MLRSLRLAVAVLLALLAGAAGADAAIPPLARVTDLTGTLDAGQQRALSAKLADFERASGSQLAVLILPSTQPETIERYGIRVAEAWKLGRRGIDDGAILIVAKNDHRLRIEVGYGLEGTIPDAIAKRIIDDTIVPAFKAGDFYGGIDAGVDQIIRAAQGQTLAAPVKSAAQLAREQAEKDFLERQDAEMRAQIQQDERESEVIIGIGLLLSAAFLGFILAVVSTPKMGRAGAMLFGGLMPGAAAWFAGGLMHTPPLLVAAPIALFMYWLSRIAGVAAVRNAAKASRRDRGGHGYSDSDSGSSSSSSSSSSGSFSGGGGSFGGGGASGSW
jgi:uncharacterized protein